MTQFDYALSAFGAVASVPQFINGYPAAHVNDGSDSTEWRAPTGANPCYVKVDLGAPQYIDHVRVKGSCPVDSSNFWTLQYSFDNSVWNSISLQWNRITDETKPFEAVTARYWRINGSAAPAGLSVATLELIGPIEAPPPPTNPAPTYIAAWLDGIEANYVPTVQDWLDNN